MTAPAKSNAVAGRVVALVAIIASCAIATTVVAGGVLSVIFARTVITPTQRRDENMRILGSDANTVTLARSVDAMIPGLYSLWFDQDAGHARMGEIVAISEAAITRQLLRVDRGSLTGVTRARLGGWFYLHPSDLGVEWVNVDIETELGPAPAWLIPAAHPSTRWVIGVHGRAVRREETLRAVPVFRDEGFNSLLVSYRNDGDAPASSDRRYSLGDTEWEDVEAAVRYAAAHGAEEIILMGWSMGGATVLQVVTRSPAADLVSGLVLESPVVDWVTALHFQGLVHRLPRPVRVAAMGLVSRRWSRRLTGLAVPIDLRRLDLVSRATELTVPILLLHSDDDAFIPPTASRALATARPDIVTFEEFTTAGHTRLWNYDPIRWNSAIRSWIRRLNP